MNIERPTSQQQNYGSLPVTPQEILEFHRRFSGFNGEAPDLHEINQNDQFLLETNHYNPKEMLKRVNFPNP